MVSRLFHKSEMENLFRAIHLGLTQTVQNRVLARPELSHAVWPHGSAGRTLLMVAIENNKKLAQWLIPHSLVETRGGKGQTALMVAAAAAQPCIVNALLRAGSNPHALNTSGTNAWTLAIQTALLSPKSATQHQDALTCVDLLCEVGGVQSAQMALDQLSHSANLPRARALVEQEKLIKSIKNQGDRLASKGKTRKLELSRGTHPERESKEGVQTTRTHSVRRL